MIEQAQPYLTMVVNGLLGVLVVFVMGVIALLRSKVGAWLEARTSVQQRDMLHKLATEAAALVEATYKDAGGPAKLSEAYNYVSKRINQLGIEVSAETIRAAIEKAVQDFNAGKVKSYEIH